MNPVYPTAAELGDCAPPMRTNRQRAFVLRRDRPESEAVFLTARRGWTQDVRKAERFSFGIAQALIERPVFCTCKIQKVD